MALSKQIDGNKYIPGSDDDGAEDVFTFPYIVEENTVNYIKRHGKIMFIIRGLPGTGKRALSKLVKRTYPGSEVLSAENYFTKDGGVTRKFLSPESKKESHLYCHGKVHEACEKGVHPIIICNSHVKKREIDTYLIFASTFDYTIIIGNSHTADITPQILAESNAQGLTIEYCEMRQKQWHDIFPLCTGWFISPNDSLTIFNELLNILEVFQVDQGFNSSRNLNGRCEGDLYSSYLGKKLLFCVAGCGTKNFNNKMKKYFLSEEVKQHNGQCFEIRIFAFVFTQSDIFALVYLDQDMKKLIFRHRSKLAKPNPKNSNLDRISPRCRKMKVGENVKLKEYSKTVPLGNFPSSSRPCFKEHFDVKNISVNSCSFIHIAEKQGSYIFPYRFQKMFIHVIRSLSESALTTNCFRERGAYSVHFLPSDIRAVILKKVLTVKSVFTGLYI